MKLVIEADGKNRIVRYGVGDFQQNENSVTVFYPHRIETQTDAPHEERIDGTVLAGVDGQEGEDEAYRAEDLEFEQEKADDLKDYRLD